MSRITLLALQVLVAVVTLALWQVFATVPVFGKVLLPSFFFSNPVDVFSQIVKWFSTSRSIASTFSPNASREDDE